MLANTIVRTAKALLFYCLSALLFQISKQVQVYLSLGCCTFIKAPPFISSPLQRVNGLSSYVLKQNGFNQKLFLFRIAPLPKGKHPRHNMFHVLRSSGKYGFSDTHMLCGGGSAARKFHLVIISSFPCLWGWGMAPERGWGLPSVQQLNWVGLLCQRWKTTGPHGAAAKDTVSSFLQHWPAQFKWNRVVTQVTCHLASCISEHLNLSTLARNCSPNLVIPSSSDRQVWAHSTPFH